MLITTKYLKSLDACGSGTNRFVTALDEYNKLTGNNNDGLTLYQLVVSDDILGSDIWWLMDYSDIDYTVCSELHDAIRDEIITTNLFKHTDYEIYNLELAIKNYDKKYHEGTDRSVIQHHLCKIVRDLHLVFAYPRIDVYSNFVKTQQALNKVIIIRG